MSIKEKLTFLEEKQVANMWNCRICGSSHPESETVCSCGYDRTMDFEEYPTLSQPTKAVKVTYEKWFASLKTGKAGEAQISSRTQITGNAVGGYGTDIKTFSTISGGKDADEQTNSIERKVAIVVFSFVACIVAMYLLPAIIISQIKMNKAMDLLDSGDYEMAYALLEESGNPDAIASNKYDRAMALMDSEDYEAAYALLEEIGNNDAIASSKYDRAMALMDSGDYDSALLLLYGLNFKDSADQITNCYNLKLDKLKSYVDSLKIGDTYKFGSYEQDNNLYNGKEEIEWIVLDKDGLKVLLISKYALDCQQLNTSLSSLTWKNCSLREWLNGTFLYNAFSSEEQRSIKGSIVSNQQYLNSADYNTFDKVFLLSIPEVNKYFTSDSARQCQATVYCNAQGACKADNDNCWWWLRSPGDSPSNAACVNSDGSVNDLGNLADRDEIAVRPALWIDFRS